MSGFFTLLVNEPGARQANLLKFNGLRNLARFLHGNIIICMGILSTERYHENKARVIETDWWIGWAGILRIGVDGQRFECERGAWATWIPALGAKYLNATDGLRDCLHHSAPPRDEILGCGPGKADYGLYTREDWRRAYTTPVSQRAAENAVAVQRLHAAGLGPRVLGLCIALRYRDGTRAGAASAVRRR